MDELLLTITNHLDNVSELKYKDENWGQLEDYAPNIPVKWPCALIHISSAQFSEIGYNYRDDELLQQGSLSIEITVADLRLANTSTKAPLNQRSRGFEIWKLIQKVHEVIQGWKPLENSGAMVRTSLQSIIRDDGIQEKRVIYTIGLNGC